MIRNSGITAKTSCAHSPLDSLHDDMILSLGERVGRLCGPEAYVRLAQTDKKMKRLLLPDEHLMETNKNNVIAAVIHARLQSISTVGESPLVHSPIQTLEQLSVFEKWYDSPFREDNRFCFEFANAEVEEVHLKGIEFIRNVLDRHQSVHVRLDAHCGTAAPDSVAVRFSQMRGDSIRNEIRNGRERPYRGRVRVVAWGKRITRRVSQSSHPFRNIAREGRGWVELYFQMGGNSGESFHWPSRHSYYDLPTDTLPVNMEHDVVQMEDEGIGEVFYDDSETSESDAELEMEDDE